MFPATMDIIDRKYCMPDCSMSSSGPVSCGRVASEDLWTCLLPREIITFNSDTFLFLAVTNSYLAID